MDIQIYNDLLQNIRSCNNFDNLMYDQPGYSPIIIMDWGIKTKVFSINTRKLTGYDIDIYQYWFQVIKEKRVHNMLKYHFNYILHQH